MLVDSHAHLNMLAASGDLGAMLQRARDNGVEYIQTICTHLSEFQEVLSIAKAHERVFASVGVHPAEVQEGLMADELVQLAAHDKVIGLGETGLDYYYQPETKALQISCFEQHIIAAQKTQLPVIVHTRDAEEDTIAVIKEGLNQKQFKGLIHCFTSSKDFAAKVLDLGMYISLSGIVTFKNAESLREVARFVPLDRLLIETDAPYLTPVPMRGKTNEPAFVKHVAEFLAELKNISFGELSASTTENFFTLFSKAQR